MVRRSSLKNALEQASSQTETVAETHLTKEDESKDKIKQPPSRRGKKAITGHFDPAVSRQLKQIALDQDTTVQALLAEALNDLFSKYKQKPLA